MAFFNEFLGYIQSGDLDDCKKYFKTNKNKYTKIENEHALIETCMYGNLDIFKWLLEIRPDTNIAFSDDILFKYSCQSGSIEIAKYIFENKKPILHSIIECMYDCAASSNIELFKWLIDNTSILINIVNELFIIACNTGNLEMAKIIHEKYPMIQIKDIPLYDSCMNGHIHVTEWLREIDKSITQQAIDIYMFQYACKNGDIVKAKGIYQENEFPVLKGMEDAASNEHIDILNWLVSTDSFKRGFPITGKYISDIFSSACYHNKIKTLEWLYSSNILHIHNKPHYLLIQEGFDAGFKYGNLSIIKFLYEKEPFIEQYLRCNQPEIINNALSCDNICQYIPYNKQGKVDVLNWLVEKGNNVLYEIFVKNEDLVFKYMQDICKMYNFEMLDWFFESNIQLNNIYMANKLFQYLCGQTNLEVIQEYLCLCDRKLIYIDSSLDNYNSFYNACVENNFEIVKYLYDTEEPIRNSFDCSNENWELGLRSFIDTCEVAHIDIIEWMLEVEPNIKNTWEYEDYAFHDACIEGHLNVIELLYKHKPEINLQHDDDCFFQLSCKNGNTHIARWLLRKCPTIDITAKDHKAFRNACRNNHIHTANWFKLIRPDVYNVVVENENEDDEYISSFAIIRTLSIKKEINKYDTSVENCPICYEKETNIITKCYHMFCIDCLQTHLNRNTNSCPLCRKENVDVELTKIV